MACGLRVVTTPVGSIGELVEDGRTGVIVRHRTRARSRAPSPPSSTIRRGAQCSARLPSRTRGCAGRRCMVDAMIRVYGTLCGLLQDRPERLHVAIEVARAG